jgi:NAD(P)-dependent dehydrogenase (short-subunit alcohol dehydrogenase family)
VGNPDDVADLMAVTLDEFGRLDVLVNNAGNFSAARVLPDVEIEELDSTYHSHVRGGFNTSIAATRYWREQAQRTGAPVDARLINTVSDAYLLGAPWRVDYAAAKAVLVALTIGTAFTCSLFGVRANAFLPHAFTRMTSGEGDDGLRATKGRALLPPEPKNDPKSAAAVVAAMCGPAGRNINGQVIGGGSGRIRVLAGPTLATEFETDGVWDLTNTEAVLSSYFETERPAYGVKSEGINPLLEELRPSFDFLASPQ